MNVIEQIIEEAKAKIDQAKAEHKAKTDRYTEEFQKAVIEYLKGGGKNVPSFILDCGEYGVFPVYEPTYSIAFGWKLTDEECDAMKLCPIWISTRRFNENDNVSFSGITFEFCVWSLGVSYSEFKNPADWLMYARNHYADYKQWQIEKAVEEVIKTSRPHSRYSALDFDAENPDEGAALALHAKLCEIDPAHSEKWDQWLSIWQERFETYKEVVKDNERKEALARAYEVQYLAWLRQCGAVITSNNKILREFQKVLDKPVQIYELTFGVVGTDDDGEKCVETKTVYVKDQGSKDRVFTLLNGDLVKYFSPVSCRAIKAIASESTGGYVKYFYPSYPYFIEDGLGLKYIKGTSDKDTIREELDRLGFMKYPEKPEKPEDISGDHIHNAQKNAQAVFFGEFYDEQNT